MPFQTLDALEIESQRAYVVYDTQTGRIVHIHRVTNFRGASSGCRDEEETRAMVLAERFGHRSAGLRALAVSPTELDPRVPQRVDLKTLRLISTELCGENNNSLS
jgi:hypothetical protein